MSDNQKITLYGLMILLLRKKICGSEEELPAVLFDENVQNQVVKFAERQDLGHLVAEVLDEEGLLGDEEQETDVSERIRRVSMKAIYRYQRMESETNSIFSLFERNGIDYLPLKGIIIRNWYPEPRFRTSCDLDILVRKKDLKKAVRLLVTELEYSQGQTGNHDVSLRSRSGVHLELHFTLEKGFAQMDSLLSKVWEDATPVENSHRYQSSPEWLVYYLYAHMAVHLLSGGCGVRSVLDAYLMEQKFPYDREKAEKYLRDGGLLDFRNGILKIGKWWMEKEEPEPQVKEIAKFLLFSGTYGTEKSHVELNRLTEKSKFRYAMERIFQPLKDMKQHYRILNRFPFLLPFFWVWRWLKMPFKFGIKKGVRELHYSANVTEERKKQLNNMIQYLGLNH